MELYYIILGALCYRYRGQAGDSAGTFIGRLPWCILVALVAYQELWQIPVIMALAYVGVMFGYYVPFVKKWKGYFDISNGGNRNWRNYAILSVRGGFIAFPVCLLVGHWWAVIAGAGFVVYYKLGLSTGGSKFPLIGDLLIGATITTGLLL